MSPGSIHSAKKSANAMVRDEIDLHALHLIDAQGPCRVGRDGEDPEGRQADDGAGETADCRHSQTQNLDERLLALDAIEGETEECRRYRAG
jgi:hypothetical protein